MKNIVLNLIVSVLLICFFLGCKKKTLNQPLSFCYWKTTYHLDQREDTLMNRMGVNHLYIRIFDVDWNPYENEALPVATINDWWSGDFENKTITPAIFITNIVMAKSSKNELDSLASRIGRRTRTVLEKFTTSCISSLEYKMDAKIYSTGCNRDSLERVAAERVGKKYNELLIDCDWTAKTKDNYFYFLKKMKSEFPDLEISATLRLWQFKNREFAGVPQVDRCLLMCYSMNSPAEYNVENSISSTDELSKYITDVRYPVKMDIALPLFHWAVMFRNEEFKGLIGCIDPDVFKNDTANYVSVSENRYRLKTSKVIGNKYFRYGDEVRLEMVSPGELDDMAKFLNKKLKPGKDTRVTFFSWDTTYIKQYGEENIKTYCSTLLH